MQFINQFNEYFQMKNKFEENNFNIFKNYIFEYLKDERPDFKNKNDEWIKLIDKYSLPLDILPNVLQDKIKIEEFESSKYKLLIDFLNDDNK